MDELKYLFIYKCDCLMPQSEQVKLCQYMGDMLRSGVMIEQPYLKLTAIVNLREGVVTRTEAPYADLGR